MRPPKDIVLFPRCGSEDNASVSRPRDFRRYVAVVFHGDVAPGGAAGFRTSPPGVDGGAGGIGRSRRDSPREKKNESNL